MIAVMPVAIDGQKWPEAQLAFMMACSEVGKVRQWLYAYIRNPYGYGQLMADLWRAGETFIVVEHDVIVEPWQLRSLAECPEPWCGYAYLQAPGQPVMGLGCTKIQNTALWKVAHLHKTLEVTRWENVDATVAALRDAGLTQHQHPGTVINLRVHSAPTLSRTRDTDSLTHTRGPLGG